MEYKTWFVWCMQAGPPSKPHTSLLDAQYEADRLARKSPGQKFIVLEALEERSIEALPITVRTLEPDELPF